jgi:hypothetical protein
MGKKRNALYRAMLYQTVCTKTKQKEIVPIVLRKIKRNKTAQNTALRLILCCFVLYAERE